MMFKFIVTVFLHHVSICNWLFWKLVSKVLQFHAKLSCSDAITRSQIFTKLFHSPRWHLTKVSWMKKWEISIQRWRCSIKPLFDAAQDIVSAMRLYTSMQYFVTGSEADETSPMDNSPAIHLRRLCRLIGRDSSTTTSTSISLSWSGWSLNPVKNFVAESSQTWKSSRFICILYANWPTTPCTVSRSGFLRCFRNPIRVPRIRENYQEKYLNGHCNQRYEMVITYALLRIIHFFGCLHGHTGYLTFSLKKTAVDPVRRYLFGEWHSTGKYLQVYLGSESRFKLRETFNVSKHPNCNSCMDLFVVDYGIESSENFREKHSSWVVKWTEDPLTNICFARVLQWQNVDARCSFTDKILERIHLCHSTVHENSAAPATTTLVASAVTRFYSY